MSAQRIVAAARGWIGTPYLHQASLKGVGCDCLGLLRGVYRELYSGEPEQPPPYCADWAEASRREAMADAARRHLTPIPLEAYGAGDVLLFRWRPDLPAKHCGIATAREAMVHAHDGASVAETPIGLWRRRLAFAFRFPAMTPPVSEG
jgi:NlpC/P60 family putative phage cell wall peptidase